MQKLETNIESNVNCGNKAFDNKDEIKYEDKIKVPRDISRSLMFFEDKWYDETTEKERDTLDKQNEVNTYLSNPNCSHTSLKYSRLK